MRERLEQLEEAGLDSRSGEMLVVLCWLVHDRVGIPEPELKAARRRAMLVLASGGDPHRDLELDSVAAARLADELDTPDRRHELLAALDRIAPSAEGLSSVVAALETMRSDPGLAWRSFALALIADEIAGE